MIRTIIEKIRKWATAPLCPPHLDARAFEEGWRAYEISHARNPYAQGSVHHKSWRAGYRKANDADQVM